MPSIEDQASELRAEVKAHRRQSHASAPMPLALKARIIAAGERASDAGWSHRRFADRVGVHHKTWQAWRRRPVAAAQPPEAEPTQAQAPDVPDAPWEPALCAIAVTALAQPMALCGPPRSGLAESELLEILIEHGDISDDAIAAIYQERTGTEVRRLAVFRRRHYAARRLEGMTGALRARFGPAGREAARLGVALLKKA